MNVKPLIAVRMEAIFMKKINVGIVGCGNISSIYFENLKNTFLNTNVYACADINPDAANTASEKWEVPVMTVDEMMACKDIEIIVNLTTPQSHYSICKQALLAGKHTHTEKPLSLSFEEGCELVKLAEEKSLMLGGAPDTFMGAGIQTCRKLIDDGFIGDLVGATAFLLCQGHEGWHPSPEFYYQFGGGPMFDMGPYYLTALVNLLGGVTELHGMTSMTYPTRTVTSKPKFGTIVEVEVPTHVNGLLRFESGAIGNIITSFDVRKTTLPCIEVYGTAGTLIVPDPNGFGGPVRLMTKNGGPEFKEIPYTHIYPENSRGIGVADMAQCIIDGNLNNRASGCLANHVLEIMSGIHVSNDTKKSYMMTTKYERNAPMPTNLIKGCLS